MAHDLWFSSDWHLSHTNIITYAGRPFGSAREMNEALVTYHNELVRPSDKFYHLGDVSMIRPRYVAEWVWRFNGHKRLVRGNHDIYHTSEYIETGWEEIYASRVLNGLIFTHIPIHPASCGRFRANIHGHTHEKENFPPAERVQYKFTGESTKQPIKTPFPYINISVEQTAYRPINMDELDKRIQVALSATRK